MNKFRQASIPICFLTLISFQSSQLYKEAPVRVGEILLITLDPQSPSLAAFNDSRMPPSTNYVFATYKVEQTIKLQSGHSQFLGGHYYYGEKRSNKVTVRRKLSGLTVSLSPRRVRLASRGKTETKNILEKKIRLAQVGNPVQGESRPQVLINQSSVDKPVYNGSSGTQKADQGSHISHSPSVKFPAKEYGISDEIPTFQTNENLQASHSNPQPPVQALPLSIQANAVQVVNESNRQETHPPTNKQTVRKHNPIAMKSPLYELSGSLELTGGIAYTGTNTHFSISREVHGRIMDEGDIINIKDGLYKILASDLKGHIVAKLYNMDGDVLGFGEFDLYQLPNQAKKLNQIDRLDIKVKLHNSSSAVATLISGRSFDTHEIPVDRHPVSTDSSPHTPSKDTSSRVIALHSSREEVDQSRVTIDSVQRELSRKGVGEFSDDGFLPYSSFMMRAEKKNHWGSLVLGVSGRENAMRIYPDSMVKALLSSQGVAVDNSAPIIWGRVTRKGQPVRGAQVELAGDFIVKPIYFNAYMPDTKLESTETDGLFAFVGISSGIQAVRATIGGEYISTHVVPAEGGHVSYLEIEIDKYRSAGISIYDGQTREALRADIQVYGTEKVMNIDGYKEEAIFFPGGPGVMTLEVDGGEDYLPSRYSVHRQQQSIDLPIARIDWLNQMRKYINEVPNSGIIIGYVEGSDYDVVMDQRVEYNSQNNRIYFDKEGHITKNFGKDGGGFILFNVPLGLRTIAVVPMESDKIFTQVSVVGDDAINIVSVHL